MSKLGGYLAAFLLVLLIAQVVIVIPQSVNEPGREARTSVSTSSAAAASDIEQAMKGVHLIETKEGEREWELWADEAVSFKNRNLWEMKQVKVVFFGKDGVQFTVTGSRGEIESETKNLKVEGGVFIRSSNGYIAKTASVIYNSPQRRLLSPMTVDLQGPRDAEGGSLVVNGEKLEADLNSSVIQILNNVRTERDVSRGRRVTIRSREALLSGKSRSARFKGGVVIDMEAMRITGPEAEFEYDSMGKSVKSINVTGGVRVSDSEKLATSQNLKVEFDQDKYVFRGSPKVVQEGDILSGEEIIFLEGGKKISVLRARAKVDEKSMEKVR